MNNRGQIAISAAVVLLVTAVVGLVIMDGVAGPTHTGTTTVNESVGSTAVIAGGNTSTLANNCVISITQFWDTTNSTAVTADNYTLSPTAANMPHRQAQTVTWVALPGFVHNGTQMNATYTYECNYMSNPTARIIMANIVTIAAVVALSLAGGWLFLR